MANFGPAVLTAQISTGNPLTTVDLFDATKINNNAQNDLGIAYYHKAGVTAANPYGYWQKLRYVRYNSATNPAVLARPAVVYWTDEFKTTVSGTQADGFTGTSDDAAGILLPNSTSISTLTAALLNGNFVWICVGGFVPGVNAPASTAVGDWLYGTSGNWTLFRIAYHVGTVTPDKYVAHARSAVASNAADMDIVLES